jgi:hypothetical protein
LVVKKECF